ncbi:hypothetical protein [Caldalkalibacillus salinus]|uniref:hypothetical protein n=1 Tax=Caldalkalibacillus salinus TaxID=2803787 RepID=UPI001921B06A|nr:hypothetical protein [Caldalkalibacillus salinus]
MPRKKVRTRLNSEQLQKVEELKQEVLAYLDTDSTTSDVIQFVIEHVDIEDFKRSLETNEDKVDVTELGTLSQLEACQKRIEDLARPDDEYIFL